MAFLLFGPQVLTLCSRVSVLYQVIKGFVLYAMDSRPLLNMVKVGFLEISSKVSQFISLVQKVNGIHTSRRPLAFVRIEEHERSSRNSEGNKTGNIFPRGSLPLDVGKNIVMRFVIHVSVLNHPLFVELLETSAEKFGYRHQGVLRIPCDVLLFERILNLINNRHLS